MSATANLAPAPAGGPPPADAQYTSDTFLQVARTARALAEDRSRRGWSQALCQTAWHLADPGTHGPLPAGSRFAALAAVFTQQWQTLALEEQLAVLVYPLWINGGATRITDVLIVCRLAGTPDTPPPVELSRLQAAQVSRSGHDRWRAHLGAAAAQIPVTGEFRTAVAAANAAYDALYERRDRLREQMRLGPRPLRHLAALDWQPPTVGGADLTAADGLVAVADLATITDIGRRLGIDPNTVRAWIKRHDDFPAPLGDTNARDFTQVKLWVRRTGRRTFVQPNGGQHPGRREGQAQQ